MTPLRRSWTKSCSNPYVMQGTNRAGIAVSLGEGQRRIAIHVEGCRVGAGIEQKVWGPGDIAPPVTERHVMKRCPPQKVSRCDVRACVVSARV